MPKTFIHTNAITARICCTKERERKVFQSRFWIEMAVERSCWVMVWGREDWEYGFVGRPEVEDIRLDQGGLVAFPSGMGEGEGEICRASAFAVEL
jgi:hypothetical protein